MNSVRRLLTNILNDRFGSTPTSAHSGAITITSHPYGASGRLSAVPWEGLRLELTD